MAYKILGTERARQDLSDIVGYIATSLENPSAAASFLDEVKSCYDDLAQFPLMFGACHDPRLKALGYRKAGIKNYIMIYKVSGPTETVFIMRFFHGRQDYEKLL